MMAIVVLLLGQAVVMAFAPGWMEPIVLSLTLGPAAQLGGGILLLVVTVLLLIAQGQMGASWRMGLDLHQRPGLVTTGLFGIVRNPIYSLSMLGLLACGVMMPTWLSALIICSSVFIFRFQVAQEEAFLLTAYGDEYRAYAARVGRFVPGLGLLRSPAP